MRMGSGCIGGRRGEVCAVMKNGFLSGAND